MKLMNLESNPHISGSVSPDFEWVRCEFERNFIERGETGAACTIFHEGVKVVDLWGGYQCVKTQKRWTDQTLTISFSVSKGMSAAVMAVAHSRGLFHLDEAVAAYWPEFAQSGKKKITVRQLLDHRAGLISIRPSLNAAILADHDALARILASQSPQWTPDSRHGYHTLSLGWYQNELIRRIDPAKRSIGAYFQEEIATPLGIDYFIGLPASVDLGRVSTIKGFHRAALIAHLNDLPPKMVLAGIWPGSLVSKSIRILRVNNPAELGSAKYRHLEIPSANGIGQARAIAKVYDVLARGGSELRIKPSTYRDLIAPSLLPKQGGYDAIMKLDTKYGFGFSRPSSDFRFGVDDRAFGCPGAGGSFGMGDPTSQIGYAYLTNKMGFKLFDDPREQAVREACYASLAALNARRITSKVA